MLSDLKTLGSDYHFVDQEIAANRGAPVGIREYRSTEHTFILIPIRSDNVRLGTLIVAHNNDWMWLRFERYVERAAWITLLFLAVLLPRRSTGTGAGAWWRRCNW